MNGSRLQRGAHATGVIPALGAHLHMAATQRFDAGNHVQCSGLACTIRSEQRKYFAWLHVEREVERPAAAIDTDNGG